jgi:hypothetical protein
MTTLSATLCSRNNFSAFSVFEITYVQISEKKISNVYCNTYNKINVSVFICKFVFTKYW